MKSSIFALAGLALFACNTEDAADPDDTVVEDEVEVTYEDYAASVSVETQVDESMAVATDSAFAVGAVTAKMFSVNAVMQLTVDYIVEETTPGLTCASVRPNGLTALSIDFTGCDGVEGTATVNRVEKSYLVFTFNDDFVIDGDTAVTGSLSLDGTDETEAHTYHVFSSDGSGEAAAMSVEITGEQTSSSEVTVDGTLQVSIAQREVGLTGGGTTVTTTDFGTVTSDFVMGETVDKELQPLLWALGDDCYCPIDGQIFSAGNYQLEKVVVDLDDYIKFLDGDNFDEYTYELEEPVDAGVDVTVEMGPGCGEFGVNVDLVLVEEIVIPLDKLVELMEAACAKMDSTASKRACEKILEELATRYPDGLTIDVEADVQASVEKAVSDLFEGSLCVSG